jgi:hypothetical protein
MAVLNKKISGIPANAVYIGRGSKWGNTFTHLPNIANTVQVKNRDEAVDMHLAKLEADVLAGKITLQELAALHNKDLVCFCAPLRCHGDNLVNAAKYAFDKLKDNNNPPHAAINAATKIIVAGSRGFNDYQLLSKTIFEIGDKYESASLVTGCAKGADALAIQFAREYGINIYKYPADWDTHGKAAGYIRNTEMANDSDVLIAFWDGQSRGTKHMIETMQKQNKDVYVVNY